MGKRLEWKKPVELIKWFKKYVEPIGKSKTVGGEIIRACNRIVYRYLNDGDKIGDGYGKETCNPAARYLSEKLPSICGVFNKWTDTTDNNWVSNEEYEDTVRNCIDNIVEHLKENPQLFETENTEDMLDFYDSDYDVEQYWEEEDEDDWYDEDEDEY